DQIEVGVERGEVGPVAEEVDPALDAEATSERAQRRDRLGLPSPDDDCPEVRLRAQRARERLEEERMVLDRRDPTDDPDQEVARWDAEVGAERARDVAAGHGQKRLEVETEGDGRHFPRWSDA